jgi:hypothetical protein
LAKALCSHHFENNSIVLGKTTNEYFQYLFAPWDCSRTKIIRLGQTQLQSMYATGPRRPYFTSSSGSTAPSRRYAWAVKIANREGPLLAVSSYTCPRKLSQSYSRFRVDSGTPHLINFNLSFGQKRAHALKYLSTLTTAPCQGAVYFQSRNYSE